MVLASSLPFPDLVVSSTVRVNMGILLHALQIEKQGQKQRANRHVGYRMGNDNSTRHKSGNQRGTAAYFNFTNSKTKIAHTPTVTGN
jgi:hypothetical protein